MFLFEYNQNNNYNHPSAIAIPTISKITNSIVLDFTSITPNESTCSSSSFEMYITTNLAYNFPVTQVPAIRVMKREKMRMSDRITMIEKKAKKLNNYNKLIFIYE